MSESEMSEANYSHVIKVSCDIIEEYTTKNGYTIQSIKGRYGHHVVVRDSNDDVVSWETFSGPFAHPKADRAYYAARTLTHSARL